jgi:carboxymethylenebutenolidase
MICEVPAGVAQAPGVVVMMHGPGLDRFIEDRVQALARAGYAAVAPDLYHRQPDDEVETMTRVGRLRDDEIVADVDAAIAHLRELSALRINELAVLGFCMGGRNTYLAAGARPAAWRAAVVFYGGNIMKPLGDGPAPFDRTPQIACPLLGLFGLDDPNPSPGDVDRIDAELTRHGVPHEFHRYAGAGHAFLNFSNAERYRPDQASDAWDKALAFLDRHLKR